MNIFRRIQSSLREPLLRRADRRELAAAERELHSLRQHGDEEDFMAFIEQAEMRTARLRSVIAGYGVLSPQKLEQAQEVLGELRTRRAQGLYRGSARAYSHALEAAQARVTKIRKDLQHQALQAQPASSTEGTPC